MFAFYLSSSFYDVFYDLKMITLIKSWYGLLTRSHMMKALKYFKQDFLFNAGVVINHLNSNVL